MPGLPRQLRWLIAIRLVVITSVVLPFGLLRLMVTRPSGPVGPPPLDLPSPVGLPSLSPGTPTVEPTFLYILALVTYGASLGYYLLLQRLGGRYVLQGHLQFFGDLLVITALIWYFGGVSNPFSLLYLIIIGAASALLRRQAGFTVATAAYLLYAGVVLGIFFRWLPGTADASSEDYSVFVLAYNLAVHLFGFYAVAILTHHLAHRVTRVELELEEQRENLADLEVIHRDVIQSIQSGLLTTDLAGIITSVNRAGQEILGAAETEIVGRPIYDLGLFTRERWGGLAQEATAQPEQLRLETEFTRDQGVAHVGFSISRLADSFGNPKGHIVIFQDLTRWRQLEEEVRFQDRMAAVGKLAAGLAHEIGNPLAAISGSVQMLTRSRGATTEDQKLLHILLKESQRLDRTIKGFLRFARPREQQPQAFDIARILSENFELLRNSEEVSPRHRLDLDLDPLSVELLGDPDQISQIFWNLARNALKAMPDGGQLRVVGRVDGDLYRIGVADSGKGMTEQERANLFHPFKSFFDTGTGIGMAIVYRIVEEHGGRVMVKSHSGRGTEVYVELPRSTCTSPATSAATVLAPPGTAWKAADSP